MPSKAKKACLAVTLVAGFLSSGQGAAAQDQQSGRIGLELNRLEQNGEACRLTFVVSNNLGSDLAGSGFEMVIFDGNGLVRLMTVFDFGALPDGKTVVNRFELPDTGCESVSRILVNSAARCSGPGTDAAQCSAALTTTNRTETDFGA
ncbi:MAG: hypothetical protein RIC18_08010 [Hoeflea sp.]|uniref:hypothetical protein n=1 Tax=Hoeflea sp. TaxID=1940281 RepID=UPI0032EDE611